MTPAPPGVPPGAVVPGVALQDVEDISDAVLLQAQWSGDLPYHRSAEVPGTVEHLARLLPAGARLHPIALLLLAPAAGLAAAGVEYAWYALATNLPADRILAANLDVSFGLRPAVWTAVAAVAPPLLALPAWIRARRNTPPGSAAPAPAPARPPAAAGSPGR